MLPPRMRMSAKPDTWSTTERTIRIPTLKNVFPVSVIARRSGPMPPRPCGAREVVAQDASRTADPVRARLRLRARVAAGQDLHEVDPVEVGPRLHVDELVDLELVRRDALDAPNRYPAREDRLEPAGAEPGRDDRVARLDVASVLDEVELHVARVADRRAHDAAGAVGLDLGGDGARGVGDQCDDGGPRGHGGHLADQALAADDGLIDLDAVVGPLVD